MYYVYYVLFLYKIARTGTDGHRRRSHQCLSTSIPPQVTSTRSFSRFSLNFIPMEMLLFPLWQDDDPVRRNQNMALLLLSGPSCNVVLWRTRNRCVGLPAIMVFLTRRFAAFFSLFAKKMSDEFFSLIHASIVYLEKPCYGLVRLLFLFGCSCLFT